MTRTVPPLAFLLGFAGLLPFLACGVLAATPEPNGVRGAQALVAYGAVILAFLGGVHWGFALEDGTRRAARARLALGVVPSLVGWVALLLAVAASVEAALALLAAGFVATTIVEARATAAGLVPARYMTLRYLLSAGVVTILLVVLVLRLAGVHVLL